MKTDAEKTIQSLRKINDFPFYTARYHGNYRINEFADGAIKNPGDVVPFFQDLFAGLGKPTQLHFPAPPEFSTGCSAFFCRQNDNSALIGKNLDWQKTPILLLKTEPDIGYSSLSIVDLNCCDIFHVFSFEHNLLLAPYVPFDGMNEKGLVVTMLSVQEAVEYPVRDDRLSVGDFNIIRIILDTCQNVGEALSVFEKYDIMQTAFLPIHILIADKTESCIIEFFNGEIHISRNSDINYLTNFLRLKSADFENQKKMCERYVIMENEFKNNNGRIEIGNAKNLLERISVYQENFKIPSTIWSLLYHPEDLSMKIKIGNESNYYSITLRDNT